MRIHSIHLENVGPFDEKVIAFRDEWKAELHPLILLSGPNGSGKSTVLRAVSHLWQLAGQWLGAPEALSKQSQASHKWLSRWKAAAVIIEQIPGIEDQVALFFGDPRALDQLKSTTPKAAWLGETKDVREGPGRRKRMLLHRGARWLTPLAEGFKRLTLTAKDGETPNVVYLDGEERRWVVPTRGTGEVVADDPALRWHVTYRANEEWKGQLEASLIALKTVDPDRYKQVLDQLNAFLRPKHIDPSPDPGTLRLRVLLEKGREHSLDDLSAGEHQILIQLYLISRWLQPGGVVMIDEPDLHLHPSLLSQFLSRLEVLVEEKGGQLILTSHNPELWSRYESKGLRVQLGREA
jgi:predicted ATPase